ncbi:MAG: hypothetical protein V3S21_02060, partial [Xanthomonadales bacterium]
LTYPRLFVLDEISLQDCPQDSLFDTACEQCHSCSLRQECHWLSCLDSFADFSRMPAYTMHASLLFSTSLIDERCRELKHDPDACSCESCRWMRDARQLAREFQMDRPDNQFGSSGAATLSNNG